MRDTLKILHYIIKSVWNKDTKEDLTCIESVYDYW